MGIPYHILQRFEGLLVLAKLEQAQAVVVVGHVFSRIEIGDDLKVMKGIVQETELEHQDSMVEPAWEVFWIQSQPLVQQLNSLCQLITQT